METKGKETPGGMKILAALVYLIMICAGGYCFYDLQNVVLAVSIAAAIYGLILVVKYLLMKESKKILDLIIGIISIVFGVVMLIGGPGAAFIGTAAIEMIFAVWSLLAGFSHIIGSFGLKKLDVKKWYWTLAGGLLMVVFGALFLSMPIISEVGFTILSRIYAGAALILAGLTGLASLLPGNKAKES